MKVEVDALGFMSTETIRTIRDGESLIVLMVSVDVKQHRIYFLALHKPRSIVFEGSYSVACCRVFVQNLGV